MTINNRIEGVFRLKTPLHCASDGGDTNTTLTVKQPIVARTGTVLCPYFPSNDMSGRLRRFGARPIKESLLSRGAKISLALYTGLHSGSSTASPESSHSVEEISRAKEHIFQGVFGGGARMLRKHIRVSDLMPIIAPTIEAGCVPKRFAGTDDGQGWLPKAFGEDLTKPAHLIHKPTMLRQDDVALGRDPQDILRYIEGGLDAVNAHQALTVQQRAERKAGKAEAAKAREAGEYAKDPTKKDLTNMYAVEAIAAGTPMYFRLDFDDELSDAQVGLIARAVLSLVNAQDLGGLVRNGYGRFDASLELLRNGVRTNMLKQVEDSEAYALDGAAATYQDATTAALDAVTLEELVDFYTPRDKPTKKAANDTATAADPDDDDVAAGGA